MPFGLTDMEIGQLRRRQHELPQWMANRLGRGRKPYSQTQAPSPTTKLVLGLKALGYKPSAVAEMVGCSHRWVNAVVSSEGNRERLAEKVEDIFVGLLESKKRLHGLLPDALDAYERGIKVNPDDPDDPRNLPLKDRIALAGQILDRTGLPRQTQTFNTTTQQYVTPDLLAQARQRALVESASAGYVDAEFQEVPQGTAPPEAKEDVMDYDRDYEDYEHDEDDALTEALVDIEYTTVPPGDVHA